jgi:hypothetical protein
MNDLGLTWDEPEWRYDEMVSAQWWQKLVQARSWSEASAILDADALVYYWPNARADANLHPPLAGQLCLATHALFGRWFKDIPSRRLASVIEFSLSVTLLFGFTARRYGAIFGAVAAGALFLMPRVHGDALIAASDMPGLLLWAAVALSFWNAIHVERGTLWRVLVGVLLGLSFLEKMTAVMVVLPLMGWMVVRCLAPGLGRGPDWRAWVDGTVTLSALATPLVLAFVEVKRIYDILPPPRMTDLYVTHPTTLWPGAILAVPLGLWISRRVLARSWRGHATWGTERPALETIAAALAFAPFVSWIGNPLWWRETLPRLAHYMAIHISRQNVIRDVQTYYMGETYAYSLPWHNAWVLMGITVPVGILAASIVGTGSALFGAGRDRLPLYFLIHAATLPVIRMLEVPAHDGVRLFLPTFFFLAALAAVGLCQTARWLGCLTGHPERWNIVLASLMLGTAAWDLVAIHPYELSYFNPLIGGARGARNAGFEVTYWYDAFNERTLREIEERLPPGATVDFLNPLGTTDTFADLQSLGELRSDIQLGLRDARTFPYVWLLTQDSKATPLTRLMFAMSPWYENRPPQLGGLRVASVIDPVAVSRAWALQLLLDAPSDKLERADRKAPEWVRRHAPQLARLWGDGIRKYPSLSVNMAVIEWARTDPAGLLAAARNVASGRAPADDNARRLMRTLRRHDALDAPGRLASERLLQGRPQALVEAASILTSRPADLVRILRTHSYIDPESMTGYLDRDLP